MVIRIVETQRFIHRIAIKRKDNTPATEEELENLYNCETFKMSVLDGNDTVEDICNEFNKHGYKAEIIYGKQAFDYPDTAYYTGNTNDIYERKNTEKYYNQN